MTYTNELSFMMDIFKKCHVPAIRVVLTEPAAALIPSGLDLFFADLRQNEITVRQYLGTPDARTLYRKQDAFSLCYRYFLLPETDSLLFVGPFLSQPVTQETLSKIALMLSVSSDNRRYLEEILSAIPILKGNDPLLLALDTFCERIFKSRSFAVVDVAPREALSEKDPVSVAYREAFDDTLVNMKAMERRYRFENELIEAVALGQIHKESLLTPTLSERYYEERSKDPLRNAQNYCIIMNTLLRKAAEQGGVHPLHLDRSSSQFAHRIEKLRSVSDCHLLMRDMFLSYCQLVRQNTCKAYSRVVREAMLFIESNLSSVLTLKTLSEKLCVSPGYLSAVFKKESGNTLSEYIRKKRMAYAGYLLKATSLQVQTVASHCGILDVQYFSKLFKKETGRTPREYREGHGHSPA